MKHVLIAALLGTVFLLHGCSSPPSVPDPPPKPPPPPAQKTWTMTGLLKDWFVTPFDIAIRGDEIYVSGYFNSRVAVVGLDGRVLRYHAIEKGQEYDTVCLAVNSRGQMLAMSSRGVWELRADGTTAVIASSTAPISHMTIGPDDSIYYAMRANGKSKIMKMVLPGAASEVVTVDSSWINDLDFDASGRLFMFDVQYGRILTYSPGQGIRPFATVFPAAGNGNGGEGVFMAFDAANRLYICSPSVHLSMVAPDGKVLPLDAVNISADIISQNGLLYAMDTYTSKLYEIRVDNTTIRSKKLLRDGVVPWQIDHQGDTIVGQRGSGKTQSFFNYDSTQPGRFEANPLLNTLQPNQYTFDDEGNTYLLFGKALSKLDAAGREAFRVMLPGNFSWDTRLHYNRADGKVYYFDRGSNSVVRANAQGAETYHRFSMTVVRCYLAFSKDGKGYAGTIAADGARLLDISSPPAERVIWQTNVAPGTNMFHIATDAKGNLYAALGPKFQAVYQIDPLTGTALPLFGASAARYDWGFVDPQGFTVTDAGTVVLSAPGVLIKFVADP